MTVAEVARILEVAPRVVYDLCANGKIGHIRIGVRRGSIRITQADLDRYIASARVEPYTPSPVTGPPPLPRHAVALRPSGWPHSCRVVPEVATMLLHLSGQANLDELLQKMSSEKRGLFEKIAALRKRIGPVKFDVVEALREIREDGRQSCSNPDRNSITGLRLDAQLPRHS